MQEQMVDVIRELMKTQGMSIRKISAEIAKEHGGSALGYTQQISRILNDPSYDPNFSTVEKILTALKCSLWQTNQTTDLKIVETRLDQLGGDVAEMKSTIADLSSALAEISDRLDLSD
ncbi:XRE family transcriptional regulator [Phormidesmis priestleyi ULC007]|uniref:XRE family transcriptional regulator n=1 Tax=Phormidesmis priestleyi ULC007 TaxID=1920490 RepID=A0A2T1DDN5_9CYAN|nr:helix-turn-helix transcriptional regulator [Phormidesmis priestleyi]PSB18577.1 XRE family transcriptional regulator [Phormidesmis priestleyi ULC007]PZO49774.1 MAG: XRE family transcriptional regulator [Phormidesmis priestleyi]